MRRSVTETCFPIHPVQFWSVGISFVDIGLVLKILTLTSLGNTLAHYRVCGCSDFICLPSSVPLFPKLPNFPARKDLFGFWPSFRCLSWPIRFKAMWERKSFCESLHGRQDGETCPTPHGHLDEGIARPQFRCQVTVNRNATLDVGFVNLALNTRNLHQRLLNLTRPDELFKWGRRGQAFNLRHLPLTAQFV